MNRRLDEIGWGLFFLMMGGLWLVPNVPDGTWLTGAGLILLGINAVRHFNGIPISGFTTVLGLVAVGAGLAGYFGMKISFFAVVFILIGVSMVAKPLFDKTTSRRASQ